MNFLKLQEVKKYLVEDIYLKGSKSTKSPKQDTLLRRKKKGLKRITTSAGQYIDKGDYISS